MKKFAVILLLIGISLELSAQSFYNRRIDRRWIASVGTGTAKYFGDLANSGQIFQSTRYNLEAGLEYRFTSRVSARTGLTYFRIHGDDKDANSDGRVVRNLNFVGNNVEISAVGIVQLFDESGRYYQRPVVNVNFFAGIALLYFNPKTNIPATDYNGNPFPDAGKMTSLRQYQTEQVSYGPVTLAVPFGVGVKLKVSPFLNISANGGYRYTFTDYLDDISNKYVGEDAFTDPLAQALADRRPEIGLTPFDSGNKRGDPTKKDGYFMLSVRAEYYLPSNIFGNNNNRGRTYKKPKYRRGGKRR
ncbi:MAG: outer membrane beta-barrel protein [Cyclobacteriaceae bacterium]|nr:outer membrane beta-barrel protein [Cyclobacteriaceae bacterium]